MRVALFAAVALLATAAPADAQLRALGDADAGPALLGGQVVVGHARAGQLSVTAGDAVALGSIPMGRDDEAWLDASGEQVAALVGSRLWVSGPGGFSLLADRVGEPPVSTWVRPLQLAGGGVVTLEDDRRAVLRSAGGSRELALPPGADPALVATAGGLGVAATLDGALVVFDLGNDSEVRQIALGRYDASTINGLAISPAGDVAATVPVGDGDDVLLWAPAGEDRVRVLARGREYSAVATAGGHVAWVGGDGLRDGVRVFVIDAASRRITFKGPPAFEIGSLSFDGSSLAFRTSACVVAGPATASRRTLPEGPCVRTEVGVAPEAPAGGRYLARVACINAAERSCRVVARVRVGKRVVARGRARVPRGSARVLALKLDARGRDARPSRLRLFVTVSDPDGRSRVAYEE